MTDHCDECDRGFADYFDIIIRISDEEVRRNLCVECYERCQEEEIAVFQHIDSRPVSPTSIAIARWRSSRCRRQHRRPATGQLLLFDKSILLPSEFHDGCYCLQIEDYDKTSKCQARSDPDRMIPEVK